MVCPVGVGPPQEDPGRSKEMMKGVGPEQGPALTSSRGHAGGGGDDKIVMWHSPGGLPIFILSAQEPCIQF